MKRAWCLFAALLCVWTSVPAYASTAQTTATKNGAFPDIQGHWAQSAVESMATIKVFQGYPDGKFYPNQSLTRAEFISSLNRAVNMGFNLQKTSTTRTTPPFHDVSPADWYWGDVQAALKRGWITVSDYGDYLHPNDPIPRKEMARMISRVSSQLNVELPDIEAKTFPDVSESSAYYDDIRKAARLGVLSGDPDGSFRPEGTLTRAEAAVVLMNLLHLDMPKSPYAAAYSKWAWEAAKAADMFIAAGWEGYFSQSSPIPNLDDLRAFASDKAINQYRNYLSFVRSQPGVDTSNYGFWMGNFYPTYINNNLALVSWYLTFNKKIGDQWYAQKTDPFTILIQRENNRIWKVADFPIHTPKGDQLDWPQKAPSKYNRRITFLYEDSGGTYYGENMTQVNKQPDPEDAIPVLNHLFEQSYGKLHIIRVMGLPADQSPQASLIEELEDKQEIKVQMNGEHHLVVNRTGNWIEFTNGPAVAILEKLWVDFNYNGGQYVALSIDGIPWTKMSEDPFWRKLQAYPSSKKVKDDAQVLSNEFQTVLEKYQS